MSTAALRSRWAVQGASFALWALAGASAVAWGLKLSTRAAPAVAAPGGRAAITPDPAAIGRLLGSSPMAATAAVAPVASRMALLGVATQGGTAVALIAIEGKPARPYRLGASVDEGLVLQSVQGRRALLGPAVQGPATVTLELPQARPDTVEPVPTRPQPPAAAVVQPPTGGIPMRPGVSLPAQASPGLPVQPGAAAPAQASPGQPLQPGAGAPAQASPGQPVQPRAGFPLRPGESAQRGLPAAPR